jgi:hypothetical protein
MASVPGLLPLPPASTRVVEPCGGRSGTGVRARGWRRAVGRRAAVTLVDSLDHPAGGAQLVRRPAPTSPTAPLVCAGIAFPARSRAGHAAVALAADVVVGPRVAGPDRARRCSLPVTAGLVEVA